MPRLLAGFGAALLLAAVWAGLTAWTGATYHLAPLLAGAVPGFVARIDGEGRRGRWDVPGAFLLGLLAVAAGWIVIVALGIEPTATIVAEQPGGVPGEVAAGALLGGLLGAALLLTTRSTPSPDPPARGRSPR